MTLKGRVLSSVMTMIIMRVLGAFKAAETPDYSQSTSKHIYIYIYICIFVYMP